MAGFEQARRLAYDLLARVAGERREGGIDGAHDAVRIGDEDGVGRVLEEGAVKEGGHGGLTAKSG